MWNAKADGLNSIVFSDAVGITQLDIMLAERRGRELRSQAITAFFRSISNAVKNWMDVRRKKRELYQLDDRILKDIGLTRGEINNVVGGTNIDAGFAFAPLVKFGIKTVEKLKVWANQRKTYQQLVQMDDHMLEDIGIMRHEIESIAYRGKVRKPILHAPVSAQSLRSNVIADVATKQDRKPRAA